MLPGTKPAKKVVVALRDISRDTVITDEMLEIREISSGAVHRGCRQEYR